jgi:hypothetical protein
MGNVRRVDSRFRGNDDVFGNDGVCGNNDVRGNNGGTRPTGLQMGLH